MAKKYGKYSTFFYKAFESLGLQRRDDREKSIQYHCNSNYFESIDDEHKAYWLGFLYADGFITSASKQGNRKVGLSLEKKDVYHIYKFKEDVEAEHPVHMYISNSGYSDCCEYGRIIITDPKLAQGLINAGCVEQKTDILRFPEKNILPKELQHHFIRGYFDGDGSIYYSNGTHHVSICGTDDILYGIQSVLLNNNIIKREYKFDKRKPGQIVSNFRFGGNNLVKSFCDFIYDKSTISLDRKYDIYLSLITDMDNLKHKKRA